MPTRGHGKNSGMVHFNIFKDKVTVEKVEGENGSSGTGFMTHSPSPVKKKHYVVVKKSYVDGDGFHDNFANSSHEMEKSSKLFTAKMDMTPHNSSNTPSFLALGSARLDQPKKSVMFPSSQFIHGLDDF